MKSDGSAWLAALKSTEREGSDEALRDMADFVHRSLAKGFGQQLSDADLDDLTQETVLKVTAKHETFREDSRFATWVAAIAVNTALAEVRRRRHAHVELDDAIADGEAALQQPSATGRLHMVQRDAVLREAIDGALTDRQRQALLAELGGLPMAEVARRMGSSKGAMYKLLHDARKRLKAHLEAQGLSSADLLPDATEAAP